SAEIASGTPRLSTVMRTESPIASDLAQMRCCTPSDSARREPYPLSRTAYFGVTSTFATPTRSAFSSAVPTAVIAIAQVNASPMLRITTLASLNRKSAGESNRASAWMSRGDTRLLLARFNSPRYDYFLYSPAARRLARSLDLTWREHEMQTLTH